MKKNISIFTIIGLVIFGTALWHYNNFGEYLYSIRLIKRTKIMDDKIKKVEEETDGLTKMIKDKIMYS